jgi:hypothetical protein
MQRGRMQDAKIFIRLMKFLKLRKPFIHERLIFTLFLKMEDIQFEILPTELLPAYIQAVNHNAIANFENLKDSELSADTFSFYTSVSAVFSSKIEGEHIELDSFIKHKKLGTKFLPDYT